MEAPQGDNICLAPHLLALFNQRSDCPRMAPAWPLRSLERGIGDEAETKQRNYIIFFFLVKLRIQLLKETQL
jgi:hypothetical protein